MSESLSKSDNLQFDVILNGPDFEQRKEGRRKFLKNVDLESDEADNIATAIEVVLEADDEYVLERLRDPSRFVWMLYCINMVQMALNDGQISDKAQWFDKLTRKIKVFGLLATDAEQHRKEV